MNVEESMKNKQQSSPAANTLAHPAPGLEDVLRSFWLQQLDIIEKKLNQIDAGQLDAEIIHDLRVSARRISSIARLCQPFLAKGWAKLVNLLLRPIRKATNDLRDIDVLILRLQGQVDRNDAVRKLANDLAKERSEQMDRAVQKLGDKRFRKDLRALSDKLSQTDQALELLRGSDDADEPMALFSLRDIRLAVLGYQAAEISVIHQVTPEPKQLPGAVQADPGLLAGFLEVSETTVHQIRLGVKDFRYALEFLKPALASRPCSNLIRKFKQLQDQLGTIHDLDLAGSKLTSLLSEDPKLQDHSLADMNKAWREERQALLQTFLKTWYLMQPEWFEQRIQAVVPIPGTIGATKVRTAN
jgi:CHAD domain-containing protein